MMAQQILIQTDAHKMQTAIVENGRLAEYHIRQDDYPAVGSIYRGIVESVMPGMQAAFVNIGWERSAYLALEDIVLETSQKSCKPNIADVLKAGQSIVVQIKKEAVDTKGPKVSTELSLQGKTMVLLPGNNQVNISKKITDTEKRKTLNHMADSFLMDDAESEKVGVIIRTAAAEADMDELEQEFQWLCDAWRQLKQQIASVQKPGLIAVDYNYAAKLIRDCVQESELDGIYINDEALYSALQQQIPERSVRFKLHLREGDLLEQFQLYGELRTMHKRHVLLCNGAELVIDRTEAMNVIDVNTAGFIGKKEFSDTVLQTNLEAAKEIARQIRLRNLSGIILIDFIDMKLPEHKQAVLDTLETALRQDRVKTTVHGISHLGLVEVTRQRTRAPLSELMEVPCPACNTRGWISK